MIGGETKTGLSSRDRDRMAVRLKERSKEAAWCLKGRRVIGTDLGNGREGAEGLPVCDGQAGQPQLQGSHQAGCLNFIWEGVARRGFGVGARVRTPPTAISSLCPGGGFPAGSCSCLHPPWEQTHI